MDFIKLMKENKGDNANKKRAFLLTLFIYFILFGTVFLAAYALITLNNTLIVFLITLVVIQIPLKKSPLFVNFVTKYMHLSLYFNKFDIIEDSVTPPS